MFLIFSVQNSYGQIPSTQSGIGPLSRVYSVSRNELLAPEKAARALDRAHKDILRGHRELAEKEIAEALSIAPNFGAAKALRGGLYLDGRNYEAAATSFQQALQDDPELAAAYVGMAIVLMHQQRFHAALPLLDRAKSLMPGAWFIPFASAWAQIELGNREAALKDAQLAEQVAGDPEKKSGVSYLRAMLFIHMQDPVTAKTYLTETVNRNPGGDYAALAKRELESLQTLAEASR